MIETSSHVNQEPRLVNNVCVLGTLLKCLDQKLKITRPQIVHVLVCHKGVTPV